MSSKNKLIILGSGEALATSSGNTSYLMMLETYSILVDCGYQIPVELWKERKDKDISLILLTHFHADHSFGLPSVILKFLNDGRTEPLSIWGPKGVEDFVRKLLSLGYPSLMEKIKFEIHFKEILSETEEEVAAVYKDLKISFAETKHSMTNLLYRIDHQKETWSVSFSGDGKLTEKALNLIKDVSLHFQEVYSLESEIPTHYSFEELMATKEIKMMKKVYICHIREEEREKMLSTLKEVSTSARNIFVSEKGMVLDLTSI